MKKEKQQAIDPYNNQNNNPNQPIDPRKAFMDALAKYFTQYFGRGCLSTILLGALCTIAIKECKRSDIRLKTDEIKYQQLMDSINAQKTDTITYIFSQNQVKTK